MKIGILQTGRSPDELANRHHDYDGLFRTLLADHGFAFDTYAVLDGEFPSASNAADGWLITGSRFGAYEEHDWIAPLEALIRDIHISRLPMIGVCFGHQIIAQTLGGKVEKFTRGWAIGPTDYTTLDGGTLRLNAWHQDQVVELPEGAECIASNAFCENAVLSYGDSILTFQAHPEFTMDFVQALFDVRQGVLPKDTATAAAAYLKSAAPPDNISAKIARFFKRTETSFLAHKVKDPRHA
jgi:GMP synthase (glutamine-hydrolysing)